MEESDFPVGREKWYLNLVHLLGIHIQGCVSRESRKTGEETEVLKSWCRGRAALRRTGACRTSNSRGGLMCLGCWNTLVGSSMARFAGQVPGWGCTWRSSGCWRFCGDSTRGRWPWCAHREILVKMRFCSGLKPFNKWEGAHRRFCWFRRSCSGSCNFSQPEFLVPSSVLLSSSGPDEWSRWLQAKVTFQKAALQCKLHFSNKDGRIGTDIPSEIWFRLL